MNLEYTAIIMIFLRLKKNEYKALLGVYVNNKGALNFLQNYQYDDIVAVKFLKPSASEWTITPLERLKITAFANSSNFNVFKI